MDSFLRPIYERREKIKEDKGRIKGEEGNNAWNCNAIPQKHFDRLIEIVKRRELFVLVV